MNEATPSINTHILLGRISTEPELRHTQSGMAKLGFRMKTDRPANNGKIFSDTHNIVWWGPKAEEVGRTLREGDIVQVTGRVGTRGYEAKTGEKKWITETTARDVTPFGASTQHSFTPPPTPLPTPKASVVEYTEDEEIPF